MRVECPKCGLKFKEKFAIHSDYDQAVLCPRCKLHISKRLAERKQEGTVQPQVDNSPRLL